MAKSDLQEAKASKNDEFYTQYPDIQNEMNAYLEYDSDMFRGKTVLLPCDDPDWSNFTRYFAQNFTKLGLKKLVSTSYAIEKKIEKYGIEPPAPNTRNKNYDPEKEMKNGKIYVLDHDTNGDGVVNVDDLEWDYLQGDGDFRSEEVRKLRDEADIIVTNPPFSLFREFLAWIIGAQKKFTVIANVNAISYKEVFPMIMNNKVWLGVNNGAKSYLRPSGKLQKMGNTCWFTNFEHGRHREPTQFMSMSENLKHSKHKDIRGRSSYFKYLNYDAIEVPYSDSIPSDYEGIMGVPMSFLERYCPDQFEIVGIGNGGDLGVSYGISSNLSEAQCKALFKEDKGFRRGKLCYRDENGKLIGCYARILIRKKQ